MFYDGEIHKLLNYIRGLGKVLEEDWQATAKELGLTLAELHVVWIVGTNNKLSITNIAKIGLWDRSTVMQIIKRLRAKDIVTITKDDKDLRVTFVTLTKEGEEKRKLSENANTRFLHYMDMYQNENIQSMKEVLTFFKDSNTYFHNVEFINWVEGSSELFKK
ncbi:MarR family winged helix-turn-helix transcriptional regulator [Evansella sp. AB-rgal1]|uniref:MarR family winged helix-turn-helix transcriptional regulator n=1 Tax=Evansella sp. AB-rgal1 TaxID=3242696 RepID=UPI00359D4B75